MTIKTNYAIIGIVNGHYHIRMEADTLQNAMISFNDWCNELWSDTTTEKAIVKVLDHNFSVVASQDINKNLLDGYDGVVHG